MLPIPAAVKLSRFYCVRCTRIEKRVSSRLFIAKPTAHFSLVMQGEFVEATAPQQEKVKAEWRAAQRLLMAHALRGETNAYEDIFDRYNGLMLRTAYRLVQDRETAEDAVQNALIQAWQHLPSLSETGALRPWLLRIVVSQCLDFKRRLARSRSFLSQSCSEQEALLASQGADDARGRMERGWDLAQAVKQLPVKQQHVIALPYYQGMTLDSPCGRISGTLPAPTYFLRICLAAVVSLASSHPPAQECQRSSKVLDFTTPQSFAAAPLGKYDAVSSSCLGLGRLTRFFVWSSSSTIT